MKLSSTPLASPIRSVPLALVESSCKQDAPAQESNSLKTPTKPQITPVQKSPIPKQAKDGFWGIFSSTFITIFLAEIGDKTQLATLLMSAESQSPWVVFTGAATALIATSLLGVLIGSWLSYHLSPKILERSAGLLLLFISVMLLWDVLHMSG